MHHVPLSPAILYWGTPVVLVTTLNPDNTANISPISSAFWLLDRCVLGIRHDSQTAINLVRTRQCVLNLPSDDMVSVVDALTKTTGTEVLPPSKAGMGYRYVKDKFGVAGVTALASDAVDVPRIQECPVHMEAELVEEHRLMNDLDAPWKAFSRAIEVRVVRTYVDERIRLAGHANRVDPDRWRPMIMSFQNLYGLAGAEADAAPVKSKLAEIDEEMYRPAW